MVAKHQFYKAHFGHDDTGSATPILMFPLWMGNINDLRTNYLWVDYWFTTNLHIRYILVAYELATNLRYKIHHFREACEWATNIWLSLTEWVLAGLCLLAITLADVCLNIFVYSIKSDSLFVTKIVYSRNIFLCTFLSKQLNFNRLPRIQECTEHSDVIKICFS